MKIKSKIILSLVAVLFCILTFSSINYATQLNLDINNKKTNKEYRSRDIDFFGIILTYNDELFFDGTKEDVSVQQKSTNNNIILLFSTILVIYWFVMLIIYEKEEPYPYTYENIDDIETLKKYNPMIAGCLADNRQVLSRDVTAVVLNLIHKKVINMKMVPNFEGGKENYKYIISENKSKKDSVDKIEGYVLSWLFGFYEEDEVDLIKKLKELTQRKDFLKHMKNLDRIAQNELNEIGANIPRVPFTIRIINIGLMIFSILLSIVHILNNGINVHIYETTVWLLLFILAAVMLVIPVVALIIHLILFMIVIIKRSIKSTTEKYSGKKIVQMSILIIVTMLILIALIYAIIPNKYICLDIFMIGMTILIVKTDNLMTKHNLEVLNDYYALREIKYKIKEYSLIQDEQINYIKLWEEYLIYAVAFGIPVPIVNKLKETHQEDEELKYLVKCENLYYICKAYLEVMWDMKFKENNSFLGLTNLFNFDLQNDDNKQKYDWHKF